jgi:hypothetical protein
MVYEQEVWNVLFLFILYIPLMEDLSVLGSSLRYRVMWLWVHREDVCFEVEGVDELSVIPVLCSGGEGEGARTYICCDILRERMDVVW